MGFKLGRILASAAILALLGGANSVVAEIPCEPVGDIVPICGLVQPEDIVAVPDTPYLIFSQYLQGGALGVLDTRDDSVVEIAFSATGASPEPGWGDSTCPGSVGDGLWAHGLDLVRRGDGRWQLLAVNHGNRESVEFFELEFDTDGVPAVNWRGCALAPENANFNDLAGVSDGSVLVTHMFDARNLLWGMFLTMIGLDEGLIYRWSSEGGFEALEKTVAPFPNGIALAADEEHFFVNIYSAGEVRKYRLSDQELIGSAAVPGPDNLSWASNGMLLAASHRHRLTNMLDALPADDGGPSPLRFAVVAIDPETMTARDILIQEGPPMGAGTVAQEAAGFLYIGSYLGDRIIKVPVANLQWD